MHNYGILSTVLLCIIHQRSEKNQWFKRKANLANNVKERKKCKRKANNEEATCFHSFHFNIFMICNGFINGVKQKGRVKRKNREMIEALDDPLNLLNSIFPTASVVTGRKEQKDWASSSNEAFHHHQRTTKWIEWKFTRNIRLHDGWKYV